MPKRLFETYSLSGYVLAWMGKPVTMTRPQKGRYLFVGTNRTIRIDAENAADARIALRNRARYETKTRDGRITRHYDDRDDKIRIHRHVERARRVYGNSDASCRDDVRRYPLMYAEPGETFETREGTFVRLRDVERLHLFMDCVRIEDGSIWHASRIEYP